ncbi:MAG TPA: hypothetical protein PKA00_02985 [Saprospiraceae bacterium]|nr:hypothetical protein [Saprospiraceae bacterium]HMQ81839.1 hypothetical protein [Saprospiraceae bacterium]
MKKIITFFALCSVVFMQLPTYSNAQVDKIVIKPIVGFRMYTNGLPGLRPAGSPKLYTAPLIGFDLRLVNSPFSLTFQRDVNITFLSYALSEYAPYRIGLKWEESHWMLGYNLPKDYRISLGYYLMRLDNALVYEFGSFVVQDYQGIEVGIAKQFDWLNVELRTKVSFDPIFGAIFGWEMYSLIVSYRFERLQHEESALAKHFQLNAVVGTRFFPIKGVAVFANEEFGKIGIAPSIGIELLHKRSGFSLNVEKDIWISLNGGSSFREVKGQINSSLIGIKYHAQLKNQKHIRVGVGYSLIRDLDKIALLKIDAPFPVNKFANYQVKGIGVSLSYELIKKTDIEFKHTFPILSINEPLFNPIRFSGGILYRLN